MRKQMKMQKRILHKHPMPILRAIDLAASHPEMRVECLSNPAAFRYADRTWLLVHVAERPAQLPGQISIATLSQQGELSIRSFALEDPLLDLSDPRRIHYAGDSYLTTLSHLRLFNSRDGLHFEDAGLPPLTGLGGLENFGIRDARVSTMPDGEFLLTYSALSDCGSGVGLRRTRDWDYFEHEGLIFLPSNKACVIFEEMIGGRYACLSRPSGIIVGGPYIWLSFSKDCRRWGDHRCIAKTRAGHWDSARIGAGAAPIKTEQGWLLLYYGLDDSTRPALGALLLDLKDPTRVLARSEAPILKSILEEAFEYSHCFEELILSNGHTVDGDVLTLYYSTSDRMIRCVDLSIARILDSLEG